MATSFYELVHISAERFKAGDPTTYIEEDDALYWSEESENFEGRLLRLEDVEDTILGDRVDKELIQMRFTLMHNSALEFDVDYLGIFDTLLEYDPDNAMVTETKRLLDEDAKRFKFEEPNRNVVDWFAVFRYDFLTSYEGERDVECGYIGALIMPEPARRIGSETGKITVEVEAK